MGPKIEIEGELLTADPEGVLWWPRRSLLAVADLHLEKGSSFAVRTGQMLPPYDSMATLRRLGLAADRLGAKTVVCLGDNFHDADGPARLDRPARAQLTALMHGRKFVWIEGNHDGGAAGALGGESCDEFAAAPLHFRHMPGTGRVRGEISGHLHPVARVSTRARRLSRRCFVSDGSRCVLPAFGSYTGGLNVLAEAFTALFPKGFDAHLLGRDRVYRFPSTRLADG